MDIFKLPSIIGVYRFASAGWLAGSPFFPLMYLKANDDLLDSTTNVFEKWITPRVVFGLSILSLKNYSKNVFIFVLTCCRGFTSNSLAERRGTSRGYQVSEFTVVVLFFNFTGASMSCLQHHLTKSARQLTVTNLNYSPPCAKHWQLTWVNRRYV